MSFGRQLRELNEVKTTSSGIGKDEEVNGLLRQGWVVLSVQAVAVPGTISPPVKRDAIELVWVLGKDL